MLSDVALALPILVVPFAAIFYPDGDSGIIYQITIWSGLLAFALAVKSARAAKISPNLGSETSTFLRAFSKVVPSVLYASKFVAIVSFLALFTFEALGIGWPYWGFSPSWGEMIGNAYAQSALFTGSWWWVVFPTIFAGLFVASVYVLLDSLEMVARGRWGTLL